MSDIEVQIARRRQRALEEIKRVTNRGTHPLFSTFDVQSVSGRDYAVTIRSLTERRNSCTCPDYQTNLIGTCKHIEGVLAHLRKRHARQLDELAAQKPHTTEVFLHYDEDIKVHVSLPLPRSAALRDLLKRYFDSAGQLQGQALQMLPALLDELNALPARMKPLLLVDQSVRAHLALLQDQAEVDRQKEWFLEQVAHGNRSLTVLNSPLYPYQERGALHLAFGGRTLLADDMGLGKTVQAIAASALLQQLRDIRRVLIVTPASLKHQWAREIRRFSALPATVVQGGLALRRAQYGADSFFTIINYELVRRDLAELERLGPDLIILDEAQRIKNWRTKTADAVKRLRSRYAFVLTGTPLENRLDELYSIFQFINPRILGPLWHFNDRFFELEERDDHSYKVLGYKNLDELRGTIAPYVLRRTRDEVLRDLPPRVDNNYFVEMTPPQLQAYDGFKETLAKLLSMSKRRPLTPKEQVLLLRALIKMRLICNALALHDKTIPAADREKTAPKLRELHHILEEQIASNGHKAIVFSQWEGMLDLTRPIMTRLGLGHVKLAGSVPTAKRGPIVDRFLNDKACKVFLSTDAGGVGLNLQAADLVINLDLPWNPAVLEQRIGRAHRHGQLNTVHVVNLIAQGTIEERMLDTLAAKRNVFGSVFGTADAPNAISFRDAGQGLLKRLDSMLDSESKPADEPEPVDEERHAAAAATAEVARDVPAHATPSFDVGLPGRRSLPPAPAAAPASPTVAGFAAALVARYPGRILLVRHAPVSGSVLVVVDREPAEFRRTVEAFAGEYFAPSAPLIHLMEQEGYRAFAAFAPPDALNAASGADVWRAPALPPLADSRAQSEQQVARARQAFDFAAKRLHLAEVVLRGGFPEEAVRPIRDALGWALSAHLLLASARESADGSPTAGRVEPSADLPTARVVQAALVEPGYITDDLAARLARARELTEPTAAGESAPLSVRSAESLLVGVNQLIDAGRQRVVSQSL
ncbi:MAG: DEAD/DEAH box helicase [Chloroflexi bacterium]|nr:DEAD/DEAH box helicase [Chloroflexota bacterium]